MLRKILLALALTLCVTGCHTKPQVKQEDRYIKDLKDGTYTFQMWQRPDGQLYLLNPLTGRTIDTAQ